MDWDRLITIEQMEAATDELLETGKKVGADSWQQRVKNQTPHCGFGEAGTCCRICSMGPCRITPKAPRGICGCDVHGIVARNYLRFTAGGAATHSDHGRQHLPHAVSGERGRLLSGQGSGKAPEDRPVSGASRPKARTSTIWRTKSPRPA